MLRKSCSVASLVGALFAWLTLLPVNAAAAKDAPSPDDAAYQQIEDLLRQNTGKVSDAQLRRLLGRPGPAAYYPRDQEKEELGRLLFYDKLLSGNMNTSCATCHHAMAYTGDGLALPVGEGGMGLGVTRNTGVGPDAIHERVPRNAPHVFNLGAVEFTRMFDDGRVEVDRTQPSGFRTPAGAVFPGGLDNVLAAQAMFPVTSATEMAGQHPENPIATAAAAGDLAGPNGVWAQLALRLRANSEYVALFIDAFSDVHTASDITFVHAANAIAAFEAASYRADSSPFDRWLAGDNQALSWDQKKGMQLFYSKAGCAECHSGRFQTDQGFHAIAMPQIGPGKGNNGPGAADGHDDFGRENVTLSTADRCKFRTPSLRNVVFTGPWGHDGAYDTLEGVIRHHLDPVAGLYTYDEGQALLPSRPDLDAIDVAVMSDPARVSEIAVHCELAPTQLSGEEVRLLLEFLGALTDTSSLDLRRDVPPSVPSELPIFD